MNKRLLFAWFVVFLVLQLSGFLINHVILRDTYASLGNVWRSDMMSKLWIFAVVALSTSLFFTLVYSRWRKQGGWLEGIRYGLYIGVWMSFSMAFSTFATAPIPLSLALQWLLYGIIEYVIAGVALSLVLGQEA